MKKFTLLLILSIASFAGFSQSRPWCITDSMDSAAIAADPSILVRRAELEEFTRNYLESKSTNDTKLIIPVVFHVLHKYGTERLSKSQIEMAITNINKDYSAQNSDLAQAIAEFYPIIGNLNVELRLAKLDPDGNCTTGAVYYDTELTYNASNDLKYTIKSWDPSRYLNVWSVSSIEGNAAAWSQYPGVSPSLDGVVSIYTYVYKTHTLAHEVGHYLNLMHPWGSTNEPGVDSNCDIDDQVEDTPNTIGSNQTCVLTQETCGSLDNVQNIMDYSTCDVMFTQGQIDRMRAALNSTVSSRSNLWSADNMAETGTEDGHNAEACAPVADFNSQVQVICPGTAVTFNDFSWGGDATSWNWQFTGGNPESSQLQNQEVVYNTPGVYTVSLTVTNSTGQSTVIREKVVKVIDPELGIVAPALVNMEDTAFPLYELDALKSWTFINDGNAHWESAIINNNKAMRINNSLNTAGTVNEMITSNINLLNLESADYIYFDEAYAQKSADSKDELKVFISTDCGQSWILKYVKSGVSLVTNGSSYLSTEYKPTDQQWKQEKIDIKNVSGAGHLVVKFVIKSMGGNYLYIDNLKIGEPTGIANKKQSSFALNVYPNPANQKVTIDYSVNKNQAVTLSLCNLLGEQIWQKTTSETVGERQVVVDLSQTKILPGVYILLLNTESEKQAVRLMINP